MLFATTTEVGFVHATAQCVARVRPTGRKYADDGNDDDDDDDDNGVDAAMRARAKTSDDDDEDASYSVA